MAPQTKAQKEAAAAAAKETKPNDTLSKMLSGDLVDYIYIDKDKGTALISVPFKGFKPPKEGKKMTLMDTGKGGFRSVDNNIKKEIKANFLIGHY